MIAAEEKAGRLATRDKNPGTGTKPGVPGRYTSIATTADIGITRKGMGEQAIQYARSYATQAEIKMGEMLAEKPPAVRGKAGTGRGKKASVSCAAAFSDDTPTLKDLGIKEHESLHAQRLAAEEKAGRLAIGRPKKSVPGGNTFKQAVKRCTRREHLINNRRHRHNAQGAGRTAGNETNLECCLA